MKFRLLSLAICCSISGLALSQSIDPFYSGDYTFTDLGSVAGVPSNYGGLTLLAGNPNKLLLGGSANNAAGMLYVVDVVRDVDGHIVGFSGSATVYAEAPYNDGGVTYGPNGVLYASRWPVNELGMYLPGSTTPDKVVDLAALGVANSHSALVWGPGARTYANRLKLSSWSGGQFYDATYSFDAFGMVDILSVTQTATLTGGPEGIVYVPYGSPLFGDSMLVAEYSAGNIATYDVDANGDPIVASRKTFMSGLTGAEGAFVDELTGDFLFSTFGGGDRIIRVSGFAAIPEPATMIGLGLGFAALASRRRKNR